MKTTEHRPLTQPWDVALNGPSHLTVAATWKDPRTGATYVHCDLKQALGPWEEEAHVHPMSRAERFGDVESFAAFVSRYADRETAFLSWNAKGLSAILDYADQETLDPGRCGWTATLPFQPSLAWEKWTAFASGRAVAQKAAVETIEDLAGDVVEPVAADLMNLLRSLRASYGAKAEAELRPDGTTKVAFERDTKVSGTGSLELPSGFGISIPVLKGHVENGRPVVYRLDVRLRVSVGEDAKLAFRFSLPNADRVLEDVYADRVRAAQALLGDNFVLLRAAD